MIFVVYIVLNILILGCKFNTTLGFLVSEGFNLIRIVGKDIIIYFLCVYT